jgi:hypothetical protein
MKLTVGRKSVIARNINSVLWSIVSFLVVYGFVTFVKYLLKKYEVGIWKLFCDSDLGLGEFLGVVFGVVAAVIFLYILIAQIFDLLIGVYYFKKTETIISDSEIVQSIYGFPYSKNFKTIIISDILKVQVNQSSIERIFGCGDIYIKGYSNANYSKEKFKLWICGLDSVNTIKDNIITEFQNGLQNCKSVGKK